MVCAMVRLGVGGNGRERSRFRAIPTSENPDMGHPNCATSWEERESAKAVKQIRSLRSE